MHDGDKGKLCPVNDHDFYKLDGNFILWWNYISQGT
jgi:hypothetical protein